MGVSRILSSQRKKRERNMCKRKMYKIVRSALRKVTKNAARNRAAMQAAPALIIYLVRFVLFSRMVKTKHVSVLMLRTAKMIFVVAASKGP